MKRLLVDAVQRYSFDGFVFELGFVESILPLMGELRSVLNDKQIVLVTHPESGILASRR